MPLRDKVATTYTVVITTTVAARYRKYPDIGTGVTRSAVSVPASTSSRTRNAASAPGMMMLVSSRKAVSTNG
ncbi:Uncharacterised protein [Mycobacteroides abscessus subsp. abscessus]|nr:Uncharacterised protein [Mycobacteroides abscessus subsp. abscessus]